jgi:hypothetical protein
MWILSASLAAFLLCAAFHKQVDHQLVLLARSLRARFSGSRNPPRDFLLLTHLISSLRSGCSLDAALEKAATDDAFSPEAKAWAADTLGGRSTPDFLSLDLHNAIKSGAPVLSTLLLFQKISTAKERAKRKAAALTGQGRAQAEVLSWMPWAIFGGILAVDPEWFFSAAHNAGSWLLWSISLALTGLGRIWVRRLLRHALRSSSWAETLKEDFLPNLCLRMISQLAIGLDAETALENSLSQINDPAFARSFSSERAMPEITHFRSLLAQATRTGAPLREDLGRFLEELYNQLESIWEEKAQRLPVALLAPLFLCFFPGSLLVLSAFLLPLWGQGL